MMQFISDNYVWIIVIVIVLLLALIGYLADKQGFGASMKKNNKDKKDNFVPTPEVPVEEPVEEVIGDDEVPAEELAFDENEDLPIEEPEDEIEIKEPTEEIETPAEENETPEEEATEESVEESKETTEEPEEKEDELEPIEIDEIEPEEKDDFFPNEEKSEKDADLNEAIEDAETADEDEIWKF